MSDKFVKTGWTFGGTTELDGGVSLGPASLTKSTGTLYLTSDFKENVSFKFNVGGAGLGKSRTPIDVSGCTKDMLAVGVVYANPVFRESLSVDDFTGACLVQSYTGAALLGRSGSLYFFSVGPGIVASLLATFASGGLLAPGAHAAIIASCSGFLLCAGEVLGTLQAGASVMLGNIILRSGNRGSSKLCAYPWKVMTNGKDYSYIFHEDGRCFWYEYGGNPISPNEKGKWKTIEEDKKEDAKCYVEVSWESGSIERWDMPISLQTQTGTWWTRENRSSRLNAKTDVTKMNLIHLTK